MFNITREVETCSNCPLVRVGYQEVATKIGGKTVLEEFEVYYCGAGFFGGKQYEETDSYHKGILRDDARKEIHKDCQFNIEGVTLLTRINGQDVMDLLPIKVDDKTWNDPDDFEPVCVLTIKDTPVDYDEYPNLEEE